MFPQRDLPEEINLSRLAENYDVEIKSSEDSDERASRLRIAEEDARHARWRDTILYMVTFMVIAATVSVSIYVILSDKFGASDKAWAEGVLLTTGAALVGFAVKGKMSAE